ncbi:hypothetical protein [Streptomyces sp. NPDC056105]|uniref:hypothetical protein n=1 Tax=Streptomyces sp. NPDC056105 TaxID=3345714 RepID=UPI0035DA6893
MAALATNPIGEVRTTLRDVGARREGGGRRVALDGTTSAASATAATNRLRIPGEIHPQY